MTSNTANTSCATGLGPSVATTAPFVSKAVSVPLAVATGLLANSFTRACGAVNFMTSGTGLKISADGLTVRSTRVPECAFGSVSRYASWKIAPRGAYCAVIVAGAAISSKSKMVGAAIAKFPEEIAASAAIHIHRLGSHSSNDRILFVHIVRAHKAEAAKRILSFTVAPEVLVTDMVAGPPAVVFAFKEDPPLSRPKC